MLEHAFDDVPSEVVTLRPVEEAEMPTESELTDFIGRLAGSMPESTDSDRVDLLTALEALKGAAAAAQARVAFDASPRAAQSQQGVRPSELGQGVASQVALARHDSPVEGGRHLGLARALVHEMPYTLRALAAGRISEWRATILVRETAVLSSEHRTRSTASSLSGCHLWATEASRGRHGRSPTDSTPAR